jgi:hypothetical protein
LSPTTRLVVGAETWIVLMDGGAGVGVVVSLQAVSSAAARMVVRTFVMAEYSAWSERRRKQGL